MTELPKIAAPALRALAQLNIQSLEDLAMHTKTEIDELHDMGPNALAKLEQALKQSELSFALESVKILMELEKRGFKDVQVVELKDDGQGFSEHTNDRHTIHYILAGDLMIKDGAEITICMKGEVVQFPKGTTHAAKPSTHGCRMIVGFKA